MSDHQEHRRSISRRDMSAYRELRRGDSPRDVEDSQLLAMDMLRRGMSMNSYWCARSYCNRQPARFDCVRERRRSCGEFVENLNARSKLPFGPVATNASDDGGGSGADDDDGGGRRKIGDGDDAATKPVQPC